MNIHVWFFAAIFAFAQVGANHDQLQPFAQPEPVTISEKAGIKFKPQLEPQLHISHGCRPYPAVNAAGETSGGLKPTGKPSGNCKGSGQVYGRSTWYNGVWAIMYSWYSPKDSPVTHRHDWEHVVVWIDNPDIANPTILAVTPSAHGGYEKYLQPRPEVIDGTAVNINYASHWPMNHELDITTDGGETQALIMWDQMTNEARNALNTANFGAANVPMTDGNFLPKLGKAWLC